MALSETQLRDDLKTAMRARDGVRTRVLRNLLAAVKNKAIESKNTDLPESDLVAVVRREAKQCRETLGFARDAGRAEVVAEHEEVLAVLESYLPKQLEEDDLRGLVEAIAAEIGATSIGPIMKELSARHAGRFDGKAASRIVGEVLGTKPR